MSSNAVTTKSLFYCCPDTLGYLTGFLAYNYNAMDMKCIVNVNDRLYLSYETRHTSMVKHGDISQEAAKNCYYLSFLLIFVIVR